MPAKKPKLGQNFLTSPAAPLRIVEALGDISNATVLEIGPGRGALTGLLAQRAQQLICVELDRNLAARFRSEWAHAAHVRLVEDDILRVDLSALSATPLTVVGNLPYYITSDILLHLFAHAHSLRRAVVMVQDEVADRLAARPGVRDYGVLSGTAQMHAQVEKLFVLPPSAFTPPPEVNSAVVRLEMRPRFRDLGVERAAFLRFLQASFQQKRKTLANNWKAAGIPQADILSAFAAADLPPSIRAEAVPLEAMATAFRCLYSSVGPRPPQNKK